MEVQIYVFYLCSFIQKMHNFTTTKIVLFCKLLKIQLLSPSNKANACYMPSKEFLTGWMVSRGLLSSVSLKNYPQPWLSRTLRDLLSSVFSLYYSWQKYKSQCHKVRAPLEDGEREEPLKNKPGFSQWEQERARGSLSVNNHPHWHPFPAVQLCGSPQTPSTGSEIQSVAEVICKEKKMETSKTVLKQCYHYRGNYL